MITSIRIDVIEEKIIKKKRTNLKIIVFVIAKIEKIGRWFLHKYYIISGFAVCAGDIGGGLVFKIDNLWYLRGIVSISLGTKEESGTIYCDNNAYTVYTDVSRYASWIETVVTPRT